jgi:hypothetical protein
MTNIYDEPVYPSPMDGSNAGLTKLEYFTAMAMQGLIASNAPVGQSTDLVFVTTAKAALEFAKATLDALPKKPEPPVDYSF